MDKKFTEIHLRAYGYVDEGGEWAAHCLETDLVGRGRSMDEAIKNLTELTEMQLSFALQTNQPSLLDRPAPQEIWVAYEKLTAERLRNLSRQQKSKEKATKAIGCLPLSGRATHGRAWAGAPA